MMLPEVQLPNRSNEYCEQQGLDTLEKSPDPEYFLQFPYTINYHYNSRGFRDTEWPNSVEELKKAIWCVGDSFTVGIGSPKEHAWPAVLQEKTGQRTINVSMDGASNNWIARQAIKILQVIQPEILIIHWSYLHRREGLTKLNSEARYKFLLHYNSVKESDWPPILQVDQFSSLPAHIQNKLLTQYNLDWKKNITDEELRLWHIHSNIESDIKNTCQCIDLVDQHCGATQLVHSFIPEFVSGPQQEFYQTVNTINALIPEFKRLDLARDKHHYDILTSQYFVAQILQVLNWPDSI